MLFAQLMVSPTYAILRLVQPPYIACKLFIGLVRRVGGEPEKRRIQKYGLTKRHQTRTGTASWFYDDQKEATAVESRRTRREHSGSLNSVVNLYNMSPGPRADVSLTNRTEIGR